MSGPPAFQEASVCDVCKCTFNTFRRRHHCRSCGRTLCADHSSCQMALPQFGIYSHVRVCADCFNSARLSNDSSEGTAIIKEVIQNNGITTVPGIQRDPPVEQIASLSISECKCGMPLCICQLTPTAKDDDTTPNITIHSNPKPKKADKRLSNRSSISTSNCAKSSAGSASGSNVERSFSEYETNGEGLREAIKMGDVAAAKKLLGEGVDANYCDKQRSSLLHLAAVFNQTEIALALMEYGADINCKNAQGETPLDCAPATLQYRMKQKMDEQKGVQ